MLSVASCLYDVDFDDINCMHITFTRLEKCTYGIKCSFPHLQSNLYALQMNAVTFLLEECMSWEVGNLVVMETLYVSGLSTLTEKDFKSSNSLLPFCQSCSRFIVRWVLLSTPCMMMLVNDPSVKFECSVCALFSTCCVNVRKGNYFIPNHNCFLNLSKQFWVRKVDEKGNENKS